MVDPDRQLPKSPEDRDLGFFERRVSPTAYKPAYARSLVNIPFAGLMLGKIQAIRRMQGEPTELPRFQEARFEREIVMYEARYKMVSRIITESGVNQILEIASGFSPRGLDMTTDSSIKFAEVDTPALIAQKQKVIEQLIAESAIVPRANLHIQGGDALDISTLEHATAQFSPGTPVAIITEGFMTYLDEDESQRFGYHIRTLLERYGGYWLVTSVPISKKRSKHDMRTQLERLGFEIKSRSLIEVKDQLTSLDKLDQDQRQTAEKDLAEEATVYIMTLS